MIVDINTSNPTAFYELGIRHALQEKRTFLIRAKLPRAQTKLLLPGLNALFLAVIMLDMASRFSSRWSAPFEDDTAANVKLAEIRR